MPLFTGRVKHEIITMPLFDCLSECPWLGLYYLLFQIHCLSLIILHMKKLKHQTDFNLETICIHFLAEKKPGLSFLTMMLCTSSHCFITNYSQTWQLKTTTSNYYLIVSVYHEFRSGITGHFWLGVSLKIILRSWLGLQSPKDLTMADGSITRVVNYSELQ